MASGKEHSLFSFPITYRVTVIMTVLWQLITVATCTCLVNASSNYKAKYCNNNNVTRVQHRCSISNVVTFSVFSYLEIWVEAFIAVTKALLASYRRLANAINAMQMKHVFNMSMSQGCFFISKNCSKPSIQSIVAIFMNLYPQFSAL